MFLKLNDERIAEKQNSYLEISCVAKLLMAIIICILWYSLSQDALAGTLNEELTKLAWTELDKSKYESAIKFADSCIAIFDESALKKQRELEKSKKTYPVGIVSNKMKQELFRNGLLNDVAACLFIKAKALIQLGKIKAVNDVCEHCSKYSLARVWDPSQNLFWSPAEACSDLKQSDSNESQTESGGAYHEKLTISAWKEYETGKFAEAIGYAEKCIDEFEIKAIKMQNKLAKDGTPITKYEEINKNLKDEIFSRGLLNDVATCWYIKGRSLEKLKNKPDAINAYTKAIQYPHAMTWDPGQNLFWSPSEAAKERIEYLGR